MTDPTPERLQMPPRHQRKGWRKPENAKVVTRASRWGNPYRTVEDGGTYTREESLANYRRDLFSDEGVQSGPHYRRVTLRDVMDELRGFHLVCGCPLDQPCHADLLLSVANIPWSDVPPAPEVTAEDIDQISECFREGNSWGQGFAEYIEARNRVEPMSPNVLAYSRAVAEFCTEHHLIPGFERPLNWFGFGEIPLAFDHDPAPGEEEDPLRMLIWLTDLSKVSGVDVEALVEFWHAEHADDRDDVYVIRFIDNDGELVERFLFGHSAGMRVMTFLSPWSKEFYEQTKELMAHAMAKSGLGEMLLGGGTGFTALAEMETTDGETIKVSMVIHEFGPANVPIIRAPWDDAAEDELIPITQVCRRYEVFRTSDAVQSFLGPRVSEQEAAQMAFRGPGAQLGDA